MLIAYYFSLAPLCIISLREEESDKMAAETVTDMKGNVVKMEADFSQAVDKSLPECEKLVKVNRYVFKLRFKMPKEEEVFAHQHNNFSPKRYPSTLPQE